MSLKSQNVFFDVALLQEHVARLCNEPTNTPDVHTAVKHPSGHTVTQLLRLFWRLAKHAATSGVLRNMQQPSSCSTDRGKLRKCPEKWSWILPGLEWMKSRSPSAKSDSFRFSLMLNRCGSPLSKPPTPAALPLFRRTLLRSPLTACPHSQYAHGHGFGHRT